VKTKSACVCNWADFPSRGGPEPRVGGAVEDYLEACEKLGRAPQKPYSGKLMLRVPPEVHAAVAAAAEVSGKSINQSATEAFTKAVHA
jgi:predicted HicB family RNase H-like nuclease